MPDEPRSLPYSSSFSVSSLRVLGYREVDENPTRDIDFAKALIDMVDHCPEVGQALETICAYAFSSGTGDELGFSVVEDPQNPRSDQVAIAQAVIERVSDVFGYWQILWRFLAWGDSFAAMKVNLDLMQVDSLLLLPTWQTFVIPDQSTGQPVRYEQRVSRQKKVEIHPMLVCHWAYNRRFIYGRSLFCESLNDWQKLRRADEALADGSETLTYQPNLHIMPPGHDEAYKQQYKADHESAKKRGIIPDIYLLYSQEVRKPQGLPSSYPLNGFIDNFNLRRTRIAARSRVPFYLMGIESRYAREIAMQPAIGFKVFVGVVRQLFAAGLRQVINTELALKGVELPYHYRIQFPELNVNPFKDLSPDQDVDHPGVSDVEDSFMLLNGRRYEG